MRPLLHFAPRRGWLNDPNGLIHWKGVHHLFFQYNPASTEFTNQHWGHATSTDLVTWTEHEIALSPGDPALEPYDSTAVFSGCAFEVEGRVAVMYTGVHGKASLPCLAWATDDSLSSFEKDAANPVIAHWPTDDVTDFRDHTVWRDGTHWRQAVVGASASTGGAAYGYRSSDLRQWSYTGVLATSTLAGIPEAVWECPDVCRVDGVDVLVVSLTDPPAPLDHEVWWMTGRLDGGVFTTARSGPVDLGPRFYAPQSYTAQDGRRIMIGWIRTHQDPASEGAESLGVMSLPRQLGVRDGRLVVEPADELRAVRQGCRQVGLTDAALTVMVVDPGVEWAGEVVLDEEAADRARSLTLLDEVGHQLTVDLRTVVGSGGPTSVYWDAGIVEVFRGGDAGVWTDVSLGPVREISLRHGRGESGDMTVWRLTGRT